MEEQQVPWDDSQQHRSIVPSFSRSSVAGEGSLADLEGKFSTKLHVSLKLAQQIYEQFKAIQNAQQELAREHPLTGASWRVKYRDPCAENGGAYELEVQHFTRRAQNGMTRAMFDYNFTYSLRQGNQHRNVFSNKRDVKQKWFFNVGNNPSQVLPEKAQQINGFSHPRLRAAPDSAEALLFLYTLGYWILEDLGGLVRNLTRGAAKAFRWPAEYADAIAKGHPQLQRVGYAMYSPPMPLAQVKELIFQLGVLFETIHRHVDAAGERQKFKLGEYLHVHYQATPSFVNVDRGQGRMPFPEKIDKVTLSKSYTDRSQKYDLTFEPVNLPTERGGRTLHMKYEVGFYTRFFKSVGRAQKRKDEPFTIGDYVALTLRDRGITPVFEAHYQFASRLFNQALGEYYLADLLAFDITDMYRIIYEWLGNNEIKSRMINDWWVEPPKRDDSEAQRDEDKALAFGTSRQTLWNYRNELRAAGLNLKVPLPAYILVAQARLESSMTIENQFKVTCGLLGIDPNIDLQKTIDQAVRYNNRKAQALMATLKGRHLFESITLKPAHLAIPDFSKE